MELTGKQWMRIEPIISPPEVKLAEAAFDSLFLSGMPEKPIGDKAYHSDKLDENLLKKHRVEMIASDNGKNSGRTGAEAV